VNLLATESIHCLRSVASSWNFSTDFHYGHRIRYRLGNGHHSPSLPHVTDQTQWSTVSQAYYILTGPLEQLSLPGERPTIMPGPSMHPQALYLSDIVHHSGPATPMSIKEVNSHKASVLFKVSRTQLIPSKLCKSLPPYTDPWYHVHSLLFARLRNH
jgi:hypothetical protein